MNRQHNNPSFCGAYRLNQRILPSECATGDRRASNNCLGFNIWGRRWHLSWSPSRNTQEEGGVNSMKQVRRTLQAEERSM